jgi:hypothetical protein
MIGQRVKVGNRVGLVSSLYYLAEDGERDSESSNPTHATVTVAGPDGLDYIDSEIESLEPAEFYVNVYRVNRAYGGSEEGGWYYDCGEIQYWERFDSQSAATLRAAELNAIFAPENKVARPLSSVLCTGHTVAKVETIQGRNYPERRPYYE